MSAPNMSRPVKSKARSARPCALRAARPAGVHEGCSGPKHRTDFCLMNSCGRPLDRPVVFVNDERSCSSRQNLQRFEELDYRSLIIGSQIGEVGMAELGLACVRQNGFANRSIFSMMKM